MRLSSRRQSGACQRFSGRGRRGRNGRGANGSRRHARLHLREQRLEIVKQRGERRADRLKVARDMLQEGSRRSHRLQFL
jgi:hypothetical protein